VNRTLHPVVLEGMPVSLMDAAVTHLADVLRECQLVLVDGGRAAEVDAELLTLAAGLVPDLEELREILRGADVSVVDDTYRVRVEMRMSDEDVMTHLQSQLVQLRSIGRLGNLLLVSDPTVTQLLAWVWDEAADQLHGREPRPYPHP
jgi:hypothetical protein